MLQTIDKAGQVLDLFTPERAEWGVSEVAKQLGFPKSGAHAVISSLASNGLLRRTRRGRYKLGWRVMSMNQILLDSTDFRPEARRAMEYLVDRFGETMHLAALQGAEAIYLDKVQSSRGTIVNITGLGNRLHAHGSGVGKVLLADLQWEEASEILAEHGIPALTPNTITTQERFHIELEEVRKKGYACDCEETVPGLCCVAAPVRDRTGEVVAAMSFSVPAYRFEQGEERYRAAIVETAREVSRNIGYTGILGGRKYRIR